jgi:hypothetical protein
MGAFCALRLFLPELVTQAIGMRLSIVGECFLHAMQFGKLLRICRMHRPTKPHERLRKRVRRVAVEVPYHAQCAAPGLPLGRRLGPASFHLGMAGAAARAPTAAGYRN